MVSRKDAKQRLRQFTAMIADLWNDPFRHVSETSEYSQDKLIRFSRNYEEIVEILWDAQRYGHSSANERRYRELANSLATQYQDLRPFLIAFLRFDVEDERIGLVYGGMGADAFQATWAAPTPEAFVDADDVFFADRVSRARDALKYYNDHLHYLGEAA